MISPTTPLSFISSLTTKTQISKPKNSKMLKPITTLSLALLFLQIHLPICNGSSLPGMNSPENDEIGEISKRVCSKSVGEWSGEAEMESEISRRVMLMQKRYISYETLKRGMVPCTKPGASYYHCEARQANRYSRGCEVIAGCARIVSDMKN